MIALLAGRQYLKEEWIKKLVENLKEYGEVYDFPANMVREKDLVDCDLIVDFNSGAKVPDGIPHLVIDLGYTHRQLGYYQVGSGSLNSLIKAEVNKKRDLFKIEAGRTKHNSPILILGQKEDDKQHGFSGRELKQMYRGLVDTIKDKYPDNQIWFRNHPKSKHSFIFSGVTNKDNVIIDELYGLVGAVITYNSTGALPFLAQGVPVFCDKSAFYNHVCMSIEDIGNDFKVSSKENRGLLFSQIVYSQFTKQELSKPELLNTLIKYAKTGEVPQDWLAQPEEKPEDPITQQQFELVCDALEENNFPKARKMVKQVFPDERFKDRTSLDEFCKETATKFKTQGSM